MRWKRLPFSSFSCLRSPCRVSMPLSTVTWTSSLLTSGSSALTTKASSVSAISTRGDQSAALSPSPASRRRGPKDLVRRSNSPSISRKGSHVTSAIVDLLQSVASSETAGKQPQIYSAGGSQDELVFILDPWTAAARVMPAGFDAGHAGHAQEDRADAGEPGMRPFQRRRWRDGGRRAANGGTPPLSAIGFATSEPSQSSSSDLTSPARTHTPGPSQRSSSLPLRTYWPIWKLMPLK